jgi:hypothetical protein
MRHVLFCFFTAIAIGASTAAAAETMHGEITRYDGARTCAECHDRAATEVAESLHYQLKGEPRFIEGWEKGKEAGLLLDFSPMYHTYAGLGWLEAVKPVSAQRQEQLKGCAVCHAGSGKQPNPSTRLAADDLAAIDCLICHGPDYRRAVVKEVRRGKEKGKEEVLFKIVPADGVDTLKSARHAQKPTSEMCLRCHGVVGNGDFKHGIPGGESDVHFSMGMNCTDCHTVKQHKIAGGADLKAQELTEVQVGCPNCHTLKPHKGDNGAQLNRHCNRIACQTCHTPSIARDANAPAVTDIDWTTPKRNEKSALFEPATKQGNRLKPDYLWWNKTMRGAWEPVGSKRDRQSRIYPWQRITSTIIVDAATGSPLPIKTGVYAATGDVGAAAGKGAAEAKQPYSGQWKGVRQTVLLSVNHQIAPKTEALQCDDCHGENAKVDLKALGYGRP